jgi:hypothetical protein
MPAAATEPGIPEAPAAIEYAGRLADRRAEEARQAWRYRQLVKGRRIVFGLLVILALLSERESALGKLILLVPPAILFEILLRQRERIVKAWRRAARAAEFYETRLARLGEQWAGTGSTGRRFLDESHLYALDLDLFGRGGLFELLSLSSSRTGEATLAHWLLAPASAAEVWTRQEAVAELRTRLDLREDLALLAAEAPTRLDLGPLADWALEPPLRGARLARPVAWLASGLVLLALAGLVGLGLDPSVFVATVLLAGGVALLVRRGVRQVLATIEGLGPDLSLFARVLRRLEDEQFAAVRPCQLRALLVTSGPPASRRVARLGRFVERLRLAPVTFPLLGMTRLALAIEAWRRANGAALGDWLKAAAEFEALEALAAYSYEHPEDPFPEVIPDGLCFEGEALGHPLIPEGRCIRNDVRLGGEQRLLAVSGSNMSGKSTLLRTVGINAVLALAGAPVRARQLRLSPLSIGATLRVQDSLQAGKSRFYAEVTRLREILDLAGGTPPVLFLLDELLQGTNSHDRRVGAEAILRLLLDAGAVGIVTTHDLALTEVADRLAPRAANIHFEDQVQDGKMTFDYRARPGVVPRSNALALMRALGIAI